MVIGPMQIGFDPDRAPKWVTGDKIEYRVHGNAALGRRKHDQWVIGEVLNQHFLRPFLWVWNGKQKKKVHPGLVRARSKANASSVLPPYLTAAQRSQAKKNR